MALESQSLAQEIYACTRQTHNELTTLLTTLLPFSLPPHTSSPSTYAIGLIPIALIYRSFETLLLRSLSNPSLPPQTLSILKSLYIPMLLRSERIESDICTLLAISPSKLESSLSACQADATLPSLRNLLRHIDRDVTRRPYTLTAYAYVLYNALFNGGCWMRAQLKNARKSWTLPQDLPSQDETPRNLPSELHDKDWGLRFWHFDPMNPQEAQEHREDEGSDEKPRWMKLDPAATALKAEFKTRIERVENTVHAEQRQAIVEEAKVVFESMKAIVLEMAAAGAKNVGQGETLRLASTRNNRKRRTAMANGNSMTKGNLIPLPFVSKFWIRRFFLESNPFNLIARLLSTPLPFWIMNLFLAFSWSCLSLLASQISISLPRTQQVTRFEELRREET